MVGPVGTDEQRREEIAANLRVVRDRIAAACAKAGRAAEEITLVAVTKTHPPSDVEHLAALGVTDVGENRDQEAAPKAAEVAAAGVAVRWHFVGQLQRNKARSVVRYADMVHSVDSVRLARALGAAAQQRGTPLAALVQVSLDGEPGRGGALPDSADPDLGLEPVLAAVAAEPALALRGLMAVAPLPGSGPLGDDPARAFEQLARIATRVRQTYPDATVLSAGMSSDVEQAINYGATHVRLGSAVLGNRTALL